MSTTPCPHPVTRSTTVTLQAVALAVWGCGTALAQPQVVKPPVAQYWMDVATVSMAGMDDMPEMGGLSALGGLFGGKGVAPQGGVSFGQTRGMMPGRWLDLAVRTQRKPAGTQAVQTIPAGLSMGPQLTLLPPQRDPVQPAGPSTGDTVEKDEVPEQPKGRILMYWGCSETVRPGQPKVLDFSKASFQDYGKFMAGRSVRERGAMADAGNAIWPNTVHGQRVPRQASLQGTHTVSGEGIPASLQFSIGQAQDFMPRLALSVQGGGQVATAIQWAGLASARAYFLNAMGGGDNDMVIWSSSELPEPGWGLMGYASPANIDKWLQEKVLLSAQQTQCAIPAGIFAHVGGGMLQGIAYGQELNLAHPPRPTDRKQPWEPEWAARIRVKSVAMLPLEQSERPALHRPATGNEVPPMDTPPTGVTGDAMPPAEAPGSPLPQVPNLGNVLKGLFGR